ncbi:hypothetical protein Ciccas_013392, partial [Cichlidogyrus casuarinus]
MEEMRRTLNRIETSANVLLTPLDSNAANAAPTSSQKQISQELATVRDKWTHVNQLLNGQCEEIAKAFVQATIFHEHY